MAWEVTGLAAVKDKSKVWDMSTMSQRCSTAADMGCEYGSMSWLLDTHAEARLWEGCGGSQSVADVLTLRPVLVLGI